MKVCDLCFETPEIRDFVRSEGNAVTLPYTCDYCGADSDVTHVMDAMMLSEKLQSVVLNFYTHELVHGLYGSARSYCDEDEDPIEFAGLLDLVDVCGNLFFEDDSIRLANFIVEYRNWHMETEGGDTFFTDPYENVWKENCWFEQLEDGLWFDFSEKVKHVARFFDHSSYSRTNFLESLVPTFDRLVVSSYPRVFYRARVLDSVDTKIMVLKNSERELDKPPKRYAGYNRFSPAGISYIYLADSLETALVEIGAEVGNECAYGVFEINEGLKIVDLRRKILLENLDWFDDDFSSSEFCFLSNFTNEIARPIEKSDKLIDYVPTQIVAEFIWSKGYGGFLYDSSVSREGFNLVLFERGYRFDEYGIVMIDKISHSTVHYKKLEGIES